MPATVERLRRELKQSAKFRGHSLVKLGGQVSPMGRVREGFKCSKCGMTATLDSQPAPNGIDVGGEAVALNCKA